MTTSPTLEKFAPAFLKAQREMVNAAKDANNPAFKDPVTGKPRTYADLPSVIDAIKSALNTNGIGFMQTGSPAPSGFLCMTTRLIHESGEFIEDTASCPLPKQDPQGFGSAMTYLRRYNLAAICGIAQDDDDGNAASTKTQPTGQPRQQSRGSVASQNAPSTMDLVMKFLVPLDDDTADTWATWMVKNCDGCAKPSEMNEKQLEKLWKSIQKATGTTNA